MSVPVVSVIVPVFRTPPAMVVEVLDALMRLEHPRDCLEILVIDNDLAGAGELEFVVRRFQPTARYLRSLSPGAAAARNFGLLMAHGEYCLFVDDDVLVDSGCVRALLSALSEPGVGAAGGRILPQWRDCVPPAWLELFHDSAYVVRDHYREALVAAGVATGGPRLNLGLLSLLDFGDTPLDVDDGWLYSCHLMVGRAAAIDAGGFGPDLIGSAALGDNEMSLLRGIAATGQRLRYQPDAIVTHVIGRARLTVRYFARRTFNDGSCDAYIQLREGHVCGALGALREAIARLGGAFAAGAALGAGWVRRDPRWRLALAGACTHLGAAQYYFVYILSSERREIVHRANYVRALAATLPAAPAD